MLSSTIIFKVLNIFLSYPIFSALTLIWTLYDLRHEPREVLGRSLLGFASVLLVLPSILRLVETQTLQWVPTKVEFVDVTPILLIAAIFALAGILVGSGVELVTRTGRSYAMALFASSMCLAYFVYMRGAPPVPSIALFLPLGVGLAVGAMIANKCSFVLAILIGRVKAYISRAST